MRINLAHFGSLDTVKLYKAIRYLRISFVWGENHALTINIKRMDISSIFIHICDVHSFFKINMYIPYQNMETKLNIIFYLPISSGNSVPGLVKQEEWHVPIYEMNIKQTNVKGVAMSDTLGYFIYARLFIFIYGFRLAWPLEQSVATLINC